MNVTGAATDTLTSMLKNNAALTSVTTGATPEKKTAEPEETLNQRPATVKNISAQAQAIMKRAEMDKAAAEKLQAAMDVMKGNDPKDSQQASTKSASKILDIINGKSSPGASLHPIPSGDEIVQTSFAENDRKVTRQEIADFIYALIDHEGVDSFTSSWLEPDRVDYFKEAYANGTIEFRVPADFEKPNNFFTANISYSAQGNSISGRNDEAGLEKELGQHVQTMNGWNFGAVVVSWGSK